MKDLTQNEQLLVTALLRNDNRFPLSVKDFLEANYFKEYLGRGLILQNIDQYAVLFLKNQLYNNESLKNSEIQSFFSLLNFITYLQNEEFILVYGSCSNKMLIIQDEFGEEKIEKNKIILNSKGYYTDSPKYIYDNQGSVIYQGILIKYEQYEKIRNLFTGNIIVTDKLLSYSDKQINEPKKLIDSPSNITQTSSRSRKNVLKLALVGIITLLSVILIGLISFYAFYYLNSTNVTGQLRKDLKVVEKKSNTTLSNILNDLDKNPIIDMVDKHYYGIDISHYNGPEVSHLTTSDSISFIICKATDGITFKDPYFEVNWNLIKSNKYLLGAYHFYRAGDDPIEQANFYLSRVATMGKTDIAPIVDIEDASIPNSSSITPSKVQEDLLLFLRHVEDNVGRQPIIYTGPYFANRYLMNNELSNYRLWLADYTTSSTPLLPKTWKNKGYFIWQKTDEFKIDYQNTDFDLYCGKIQDITN